MASPHGGAGLLWAHQLGGAAENPGRRGRFPPAFTPRGGRAQGASRAQSLLQGADQLDRLPPATGRLRTRGAYPWPHDVEPVFFDWALDRGAYLLLGGSAAARQLARPSACRRGISFRRADPRRDLDLREIGPGVSLRYRRTDGAWRRAVDHDRDHV